MILGCIDWISEALSDLLQSIPPRLEISIRILITGTKDEDLSLPTLDPSDGGSKKGSNSEKVTSPISETSSEELGCRSIPPSTTYVCESPIVTVTRGRPNVAQILEEEILAYSSDVTACGRFTFEDFCHLVMNIVVTFQCQDRSRSLMMFVLPCGNQI